MNAKPVEHEKPRVADGPCGVSENQHENRQAHYIPPFELWELAKAACFAELGLEIRDDVKHLDGRVNYVGASEDRKGHKPIRVFVHADIPQNVHLTDMKRSHQWTWYPEGQQPLTPAEREARRREIEQHKAQRVAETQARHLKRAAWANKLWQSANPCHSHPYLTKKGVKANGLRLLPIWEKRIYPDNGGDGSQFKVIPIENVLLIPMKDETGALWNVQLIYPQKILLGDEERDRDFLPGARVTGLFHWLGERTETVCLAEGYATAASVYEATGYRCFVAFSAGNLPHVAQAVQAALPDARIVICGDHDKPDQKGRRAGIEKVEEAAALVGGFVALPPTEGHDFNDYANTFKEISHAG